MAKGKNTPPIVESETWFQLSMQEVTFSCGVDAREVMEIINEGIITGQKDSDNQWLFDSHSFKRIRTALRLQHDLGVNLAGAALAIELLEEIEHLSQLIDKK